MEKKGRTIVMKNPVNIAPAWEPSILLSWPTNAIPAVKFLMPTDTAFASFQASRLLLKNWPVSRRSASAHLRA